MYFWQFLDELFIRIKNIFQTKRLYRKSKLAFRVKYFFLENLVIMWKNTLKPGRPHMTMWRMRTARWIPKAKKHTNNM
jgi:hypothetical protein